MVRSQLYLFTIIMITISLLTFYSNLSILNDEIQNYGNYYYNYYKLPLLYNFLKFYNNILILENSQVIPFVVAFNCSNNNITIPNYFGNNNVIILDKYYDFVPSSISNQYINISAQNYENYSQICYFYGYEVYNPNFNITYNLYINGQSPLYYIFYQNSLFNITYNTTINILNNILEKYGLSITYSGGCPTITMTNPFVNLQSLSNSIEDLELYNVKNSNGIEEIFIYNKGNCPIDIEDYYYISNNTLYKIILGYNFNDSSNSYIIEPSENLSAYISSNTSICLFYDGYTTC